MTYEELYQGYYMKIYNYLRRKSGNKCWDAEDLLQDVFYIAYTDWGTVETHSNVGGYLMQAASYNVKKYLSKRSRQLPYDMGMLEAISDSDDYEKGFRLVELYESLRGIVSDEELGWLLCYYVYGYNAEELAGMIGVTVSCFRVRIKRMKERIRKKLEKDGK